jgi:hypothetical protein
MIKNWTSALHFLSTRQAELKLFQVRLPDEDVIKR